MNLEDMIELGDPDELIREIDRRCDRRDWDGLLELRDRCRRAVQRGKQLWGAAAHAEYRLALQAPGRYAGAMVDSSPVPFALGPLPEVAASTHGWDDLRATVAEGPMRGITAYECVMRGADLSGEPGLEQHAKTFEMPLVLQGWEPAYPIAEYRPYELLAPAPSPKVLSEVTVSTVDVQLLDVQLLDESVTTDALLALVNTWTTESSGEARAVGVEGGVSEALSALGVQVPVARSVSLQDAMALMVWAGASGGAQGRRCGAAAGRAKVWWVLACLADAIDYWPLDPDELGRNITDLEWWTWGDSDDGWSLRLAVVDPVDEVAFAISATDTVKD